MSTTTTTSTNSNKTVNATVTEFIPTTNPTHKLYTRGVEHKYGDFRDDLIRDGFAVIKGAIPRERADNYADQLYSFLEDLYGTSSFDVTNVICPNILADLELQRSRLRSQQARNHPRKTLAGYQRERHVCRIWFTSRDICLGYSHRARRGWGVRKGLRDERPDRVFRRNEPELPQSQRPQRK